MPEGSVYVGRPTKWGNPFKFQSPYGLVRYRLETPQEWDYEARISADGMRHPYYGPDGTVVDYWVRYATHDELRQMYRRTLLDPMPGMKSAYPSRGGHFLKITVDDIKAELAGRDLVCWCPVYQACHADVLLEIANGGDL